MTTFDRYLLGRFLQVFAVFFVATFGLYVIIDCFTNIDEFQTSDTSSLRSLGMMAVYYGSHSSEFFEMVGPPLSIMSTVVVLALLQKHSEIHPVLAAGIPTFRLALPLVIGGILVSLLLIGNQEIVMPAIAAELQRPRGKAESHGQPVEPVYDLNMINIYGRRLYPALRRLSDCGFTLRPSEFFVHELTTIKARDAVYFPARNGRPAGWLLQHVADDFDIATLTDAGRKIVLPIGDSGDVFIQSSVSSDHLSNRSRSYRLIPSIGLVDRIRNAPTGSIPIRGQDAQLHFRVTRPLVNVGLVLVVVPLVIRRESTSLIGNLAICTCALSVLYGLTQGLLYLGGTSLLSADLAAWLPVIICGGLAAWVAPWVQT